MQKSIMFAIQILSPTILCSIAYNFQGFLYE